MTGQRDSVINYGAAGRKRGIRWWLRASVFALSLGVLLLIARTVGNLASARLDLLRAQRAWLSYTAAPGQPAYESHYDKAQRLVNAGVDYVGFNEYPGVAFRCPREWSRLMAPGRSPPPIAFLHERVGPSGVPRLVAVELEFTSSNKVGSMDLTFRGMAYKRATFFTDVRPVSPARAPLVLTFDEAGDSTILMGEPDPAESSRFVIRGTLGDQQIVVYGRLERDDSISLSTTP